MDLWDDVGFRVLAEDLLEHLANQAQTLVRIDLKDLIEHWQSTFTADQRSYALPNDFLLEVELRVSATSTFIGYEMRPRPYRFLIEKPERLDDTPSTGTPKFYTMRSDNLFEVEPIPGSALRFDLWYIPIPSEMTTDDAQPDFKTVFHEIVCRKTIQLAAESVPGFRKVAPTYEREYSVLLARYRPLASARESRMVRVRPSSLQD